MKKKKKVLIGVISAGAALATAATITVLVALKQLQSGFTDKANFIPSDDNKFSKPHHRYEQVVPDNIGNGYTDKVLFVNKLRTLLINRDIAVSSTPQVLNISTFSDGFDGMKNRTHYYSILCKTDKGVVALDFKAQPQAEYQGRSIESLQNFLFNECRLVNITTMGPEGLVGKYNIGYEINYTFEDLKTGTCLLCYDSTNTPCLYIKSDFALNSKRQNIYQSLQENNEQPVKIETVENLSKILSVFQTSESATEVIKE